MRCAIATLLVGLALVAMPLQCCQAAVVERRAEETQYSSGASVRWRHTAVIGDQTLYIMGGKRGEGNSADDYADSCMSLDLSSKIATSSLLWSMDCGKKGPLVAGHTATINPEINMVVVFGGSVPDDADSATKRAVHLFSAEIQFWNTPEDKGFPGPLTNHTAVLGQTTGDLLIYSGAYRVNATGADISDYTASNSTLRMVTDPEKHGVLEPEPDDPYSTIPPPPQGTTRTLTMKPTTTRTFTASHTNIVIGGTTFTGVDGGLVDMSLLLIYDTQKQTWEERTAIGRIPKARRDHVAVVVNETMIVVHGGANSNYSEALGDVAVLNTTNWSWELRDVENSPAPRYAHAGVAAGPYVILTFGYDPVDPLHMEDDDYGVYILDTALWRYVEQYDPGRGDLPILLKRPKPSSGTIFGLFVAAVAILLVLLVMLYIALMHHYNRHPHATRDGEETSMLPTSELRSFGRRITVKLGRGRRAGTSGPADAPRPAYLAAGPAPRLNRVLDAHIDSSRDSSLDLHGADQSEKPPADGARFSRRTHLDDVELPPGLRNRDDAPAIGHLDARRASNASSVGSSNSSNISWSRPETAHAEARQKSAHVSDMLPRIVGSRLTLPSESAGALARYRFDELDDIPLPSDTDTRPNTGHTQTKPVAQRLDSPTHTGSSQLQAQRPSIGSDNPSTLHPGADLPLPEAPFAVPTSSLRRDSIDINDVMSQNGRFYLVNPDD
ncbi:hypothetical protein GGF46_003723 [Coemansia sp. RSA 552]|nr:hypothetical protein GGF46_003723 [Coemansia sp. RSA 552]